MVDKIIDVANGEKKLLVDVGTGSGAIAVTIAQKLKDINIIAIDISSKALNIAKQNAKRMNVYNRIKFRKGNLLNLYRDKTLYHSLRSGIGCAILAANLPYVERRHLRKLKKKGKLFEPLEALDGGEDGLEIIRNFILNLRELKDKIKKRISYIVFIEIAPGQAISIKKYIKKNFDNVKIEFLYDYNNKKRIVSARIN